MDKIFRFMEEFALKILMLLIPIKLDDNNMCISVIFMYMTHSFVKKNI